MLDKLGQQTWKNWSQMPAIVFTCGHCGKETGSNWAAAFTASVLASRTLLMHMAVEKGAKEGETFVEYIEFLAAKNYVPPGSEDWVDHIRKKGNDATHKIVLMTADDAEDLITFSAMLLRIIYEFPNRVKPKQDSE